MAVRAWGGGARSSPPAVRLGLRQYPFPELRHLGFVRGGGRGNEAAPRRRLDLAVENRNQQSLFQLPRDQRRAADGHAHALHGRVDQHAVETEAGCPRQVGRRRPLAREPVRPVGIPAEIVQQRPGVQIRGFAGLAARLDKGRTAHRKKRLLEQRLRAVRCRPRRPGLAGVRDPDIEIAPLRVDIAVVGLQLDSDPRMGGPQVRQSRHEPFLGNRLDRDDAQTMGRLFPKLDRQLAANRYLAGDGFSIADITAYVAIDFAGRAEIEIPADCPNLARWFAEVGARPSACA